MMINKRLHISHNAEDRWLCRLWLASSQLVVVFRIIWISPQKASAISTSNFRCLLNAKDRFFCRESRSRSTCLVFSKDRSP
ncbi:hypothetical protein M5689_000085 [Euphorbia peplus]|nr:hypothetical protein M5689_000085 [Euphorbia peplus]